MGLWDGDFSDKKTKYRYQIAPDWVEDLLVSPLAIVMLPITLLVKIMGMFFSGIFMLIGWGAEKGFDAILDNLPERDDDD